jgi:FKBP-type peptidyl-prolyl cis-trans isomerase SlyD
MMDNSGNHISGIINEISEDFIKMDFNHPMAGANLFFSGKVTEVREATAEEIEGHNGSCSGCSGHDKSSCSGSCD